MAQFVIHDVTYDAPESFTLKEMRIIERYCQGNLEGFSISKICGTIHVAIMRAKPELSFEEIEAVIDDLPVEDLDKITKSVEVGQSPPTEKQSGNGASSSAASDTSSDVGRENGTHESSGSPDLAGFQSFHSRSAT